MQTKMTKQKTTSSSERQAPLLQTVENMAGQLMSDLDHAGIAALIHNKKNFNKQLKGALSSQLSDLIRNLDDSTATLTTNAITELAKAGKIFDEKIKEVPTARMRELMQNGGNFNKYLRQDELTGLLQISSNLKKRLLGSANKNAASSTRTNSFRADKAVGDDFKHAMAAGIASEKLALKSSREIAVLPYKKEREPTSFQSELRVPINRR